MSDKSNWNQGNEADDLLAGIFDDTAVAAQREEENVQERIQSIQRESEQQKLHEEERRKQEAASRLSEESARQEQAVARRTARMKALEIETLKEQGKWVDPEEIARKEREAAERIRQEAMRAEEERRRAAAQREAAAAATQSAANEPNPIFRRVAIGVIAAVITAFVAVQLAPGYEADTSTYSKAFRSPEVVTVAVMEMETVLIPTEAPAAAAVDAETSKSTTTQRRRTTTKRRRSASRSRSKASSTKKAPAKKKKKKKKNKKADELENLINGANPFGSNF